MALHISLFQMLLFFYYKSSNRIFELHKSHRYYNWKVIKNKLTERAANILCSSKSKSFVLYTFESNDKSRRSENYSSIKIMLYCSCVKYLVMIGTYKMLYSDETALWRDKLIVCAEFSVDLIQVYYIYYT